MPEKKLRVTNILLFLILLVLLVQLAVDLVPYIITGRILNSISFSSSSSSQPMITFSTQPAEDSWENFFTPYTPTP